MAVKGDFARYDTSRLPLAAIFYLIIGGKDVMCAYQMDYSDMPAHFQKYQLLTGGEDGVINEQVEFYNQMITPFILREFGFTLE